MGVRFRVVCGRVWCLDAWVEIFQLPGFGLGSNFGPMSRTLEISCGVSGFSSAAHSKFDFISRLPGHGLTNLIEKSTRPTQGLSLFLRVPYSNNLTLIRYAPNPISFV